MLSDGAIFKPRRDVRFRVVGDEGVVVRQESAEVIAVNGVGASLLSLLDGRNVAGVVDGLLAEYDVERESLRRDVERFLLELREAGVVEPAGESG
jgi:hypothetical protein